MGIPEFPSQKHVTRDDKLGITGIPKRRTHPEILTMTCVVTPGLL